jgi:hypothetical protein
MILHHPAVGASVPPCPKLRVQGSKTAPVAIHRQCNKVRLSFLPSGAESHPLSPPLCDSLQPLPFALGPYLELLLRSVLGARHARGLPAQKVPGTQKQAWFDLIRRVLTPGSAKKMRLLILTSSPVVGVRREPWPKASVGMTRDTKSCPVIPAVLYFESVQNPLCIFNCLCRDESVSNGETIFERGLCLRGLFYRVVERAFTDHLE